MTNLYSSVCETMRILTALRMDECIQFIDNVYGESVKVIMPQKGIWSMQDSITMLIEWKNHST